MDRLNHLELPTSWPVTALSARWTLDAGRATSLRPHQAGCLRVLQGQVWATLDGPHPGHTQVQGDQFLPAGAALRLQPGQRLVLEPWTPGRQPEAVFSWEPLAEVAREGGLRQPLRDLGWALRSATNALGQLALGLLGWGDQLAAGRVACRAD